MFRHDDLVAAVDRYLTKTGQSSASFGRFVAGDPNLVRDLRAGRSPRLRLVEKIMDAIEPTLTESGEVTASPPTPHELHP